MWVSEANRVIGIQLTACGTFQIIFAVKSQGFFISPPVSPQYYEHQRVTHITILTLANEYHFFFDTYL
jgi:hypothetical protein